MLEIYDPKLNADGSIDCTWNHPQHGPIPFTARKDDCEEHGRYIYNLIVSGEFGPVKG